MGKAIDDRSGCAVALMVMEALSKDRVSAEVDFVFTVQEEVGLRGAIIAANRIHPDLALVLETAPSSELPGVEPRNRICSLGHGPTIRVMDGTMITQNMMLKYLTGVADTYRIPYQRQLYAGGGTDAGKIHLSGQGIPTGVISTPCRYIHTSSSMLDLRDFKHSVKLAEQAIQGIERMDQFNSDHSANS